MLRSGRGYTDAAQLMPGAPSSLDGVTWQQKLRANGAEIDVYITCSFAAALGVCWAMLAAQAMLLAEVNLGVTAMRVRKPADVLNKQLRHLHCSTEANQQEIRGRPCTSKVKLAVFGRTRGVLQLQEQQDSGSPPAAAQQQMVTLRQMAEATLGRAGGATASAVYLLLSFSLLIAYIAKVSVFKCDVE